MLKNSFKFGLWFVFFGLFYTLFGIYVLIAVATPNIWGALTPMVVYKFYDYWFGICFKIIPHFFGKILLFLTLIWIIIILFGFKTINSYFKLKVFANWRSVLKIIFAIIYFLFSTLILIKIFTPYIPYIINRTNWLDFNNILDSFMSIDYNNLLLFAIIIFGTSWVIFHKDGYIGDFINPNFKSLKDILRGLKLFIWGGLLGLIISILIYLSLLANNYLLSFYIQGVELNFDTFKILSSLIILISLINWFLGGLIIYIFPKLRENAKEVISSLILFFVIFISTSLSGIFLYSIAKSKYDYGKNLQNILNISNVPSKIRTILLFTNDKVLIKESPLLAKEEYYYFEIFKNYRLWETPEEEIKYLDADLKNIKKIRNYLIKKNYNTNQLQNAYCYILQCYLQDWDIKNAMKIHYEIVQKTNNVLHCMVILARLYTLQTSEENINYLKIISDENKFHIGMTASARLGGVYWHFGEYKKAKEFFEKSRKLGYDEPEKLAAPHGKELKPSVFTKGKIAGEIYLNNKPLKGIKVGLARKDIVDKNYFQEKFPQKVIFEFRQFAGATTTDKEGKFSFENIVNDNNYYLIIMADNKIIPSDINKLKFKNAPKEIIIKQDKPVINLGEINIDIKS